MNVSKISGSNNHLLNGKVNECVYEECHVRKNGQVIWAQLLRHFVAAFFLCACTLISNPIFCQDALVTLQYSDENAEELRYFITPAEDGSYSLAKRFIIAPDLDGYVRLRIKLKKPGFVYTSGLDQPLMIYVAPWKHVTVRIAESVSFGGDLRRENKFVNTIQAPGENTVGHSWLSPRMAKVTDAAEFMDSLRTNINSHLAAINVVAWEDHKVPRSLWLFIAMSRTMRTICVADSLILQKRDASIGPVHSEWKNARAELFVDSLVHGNLPTAKDYSEYLMRYIDFVSTTVEEIQIENDSLGLVKYMRSADQYLEGWSKQAYMSMFLATHVAAGAPYHRRELIAFYEKFKNEFPKSAAIPLLEPEMKRLAKVPVKAKK